MTSRTIASQARSRFARIAGILAVTAVAVMAAGGAEAKNKHHGFKSHHGHKSHHGIHLGFYPGHGYYGRDYGRCFYRGWDGRIYKRPGCRPDGRWHRGRHWH